MKEKKNYQMLCIVIKIVLKQYKCMNRFYFGITDQISCKILWLNIPKYKYK